MFYRENCRLNTFCYQETLSEESDLFGLVKFAFDFDSAKEYLPFIFIIMLKEENSAGRWKIKIL